jgi:hypothetical protein
MHAQQHTLVQHCTLGTNIQRAVQTTKFSTKQNSRVLPLVYTAVCTAVYSTQIYMYTAVCTHYSIREFKIYIFYYTG